MSTQVERFAAILHSLKPDVTEDDRKAAIQELGIANNTVSFYMMGKGTNVKTGLQLIEFFRKRIAERDRIAGIIPSEPNLVSS